MNDLAHWDRCSPYLVAALRFSHGTHTIDDIRKAVIDKSMQFWPGQQSAVITEVHVYPQKKCLHYFLAGGKLEELSAMRPIIESWARHIQCNMITLSGRRGWIRSFLAGEDYEERWTVMSKELSP